jgi:hypothetical protein
VQLNANNFVNVRWLLETAPTRGEGFNTNQETIDAQGWDSDWDHLIAGTYTTILSDRASNVIRVGRIGEELGTGAQAFFDDDVNQIGFDGRDPFSIGQRNVHPPFITGKGARASTPSFAPTSSTRRSPTSRPTSGARNTPSRWAAGSAPIRVNGDLDNNDRPIRGINDLVCPIVSEVDSHGRAVINGLEGPGSLLFDMSFRYQIALGGALDSLDLFYDIFNVFNRTNLVPPTGNRQSSLFMVSTAAQFPRQMQFGIRLRF